MRKVIASPYMSLDGLIALPDGSSGWSATGSERYHREILPLLFEQADTIALGRKTYETMVQFWPFMSPEEDRFATSMNTLPKLVFSQSRRRGDVGQVAECHAGERRSGTGYCLA
jgi:dihydrofolate reductase